MSQPPDQTPLHRNSDGPRRSRQAIVLTVLLWPSCAAGAVVGGFVGAITGVIGDDSGGWVALAWAVMGIMIGIAVGAAVLAWIWAHTCGRVRWLPIITLTPLMGVSGVIFIVVVSQISDTEILRIVAIMAGILIVTAVTYLIGLRTPMRIRPPEPPVAQNVQFGPIGATKGP